MTSTGRVEFIHTPIKIRQSLRRIGKTANPAKTQPQQFVGIVVARFAVLFANNTPPQVPPLAGIK